MKRITKIEALPTAKIVCLIYLLTSLLVSVPMAFYTLLKLGGVTKEGAPWWFFLLVPFIYAAVSFVMLIVGASLYNFLAKRIGGMAVEIEEEQAP
jgi:hypothetical protein